VKDARANDSTIIAALDAAPRETAMTLRVSAFAAVTMVASFFAAHAHAAAQRTFVSTTGVANPACSLAAPCRAFSEALAATLPAGEIVVLDSGGYGGGTITQAVSIVAPPGVYAGISVLSGDGITVNAGAGDVVKLRGLTLNGLGGVNGIFVNTVGLLEIDEVRVSGFSFRGLNFAASGRLTVTNSVFENSGESGLHAQPASGTATVTLDQSRFDRNAANGAVFATGVSGSILRSTASHNASVGFLIDAGGNASLSDCKVSDTYDAIENYGILVRGGSTQATISRCDVFGAFYGYTAQSGAHVQVADSSAQSGGAGFSAQGNGTEMFAERSTASNDQVGFQTFDGSTAHLHMSNCASTNNNFGVYVGSGAVVETRQNNTVRGNPGGDVFHGALTAFGPL